MITLDTVGSFTWDFGNKFLIETNEGLFVFSDPEYNGDNTIRKFEGDPKNFTMPNFMGRDKGTHVIRDFCGENVRFI